MRWPGWRGWRFEVCWDAVAEARIPMARLSVEVRLEKAHGRQPTHTHTACMRCVPSPRWCCQPSPAQRGEEGVCPSLCPQYDMCLSALGAVPSLLTAAGSSHSLP